MFALKPEVPATVAQWLRTSYERKQRIRIFYGDRETGRDWMEEHDTLGHIGRSTGATKIPLLIKNSRSLGGGAILEQSIVRIDTKDSHGNITTVYKHPYYHQPELSIKIAEYVDPVSFPVFAGDTHVATFGTKEQAERWMKFMKGERWAK